MGKNLKGKECGKGIVQRKDGLYAARYTSVSGKRKQKNFVSLQEARKWLDEERYMDTHAPEETVIWDIPGAPVSNSMTVSKWFDYWIKNIVSDRAYNTLRNYKNRFDINVKPVMGDLKLADIRPMHCQAVLNKMYDNYAGSTIRQASITMGTLFRAAVDNGLIAKHPMDGVHYNKPVKAVDDIHFLTVEEQQKFLAVAQRSHNYRQYALILETGLRTAELIGLTWDAIDWDQRTLTVCKTLEYRHERGTWMALPPKSAAGYRTIPLTDRAYEILQECYAERYTRKESDLLSTTLDYLDRRSGRECQLCLRDLVFINFRTGEPAKNSSYDTHLYKLCDEAGIERFCMHALRHTYATRAIESGMQPKILQKLLGHSSLKMTMDRYVHVTGEAMENAVHLFAEDSQRRNLA